MNLFTTPRANEHTQLVSGIAAGNGQVFKARRMIHESSQTAVGRYTPLCIGNPRHEHNSQWPLSYS